MILKKSLLIGMAYCALTGCSTFYQPINKKTFTSANIEHTGALYAGAAKVVITPPKNAPFAGYGPFPKKGQKVYYDAEKKEHHDLYARAVVLYNGGENAPDKKLIAYVSADILVPVKELSKRVKERITPEISLVIAATHPHSSFGGYWEGFLPEQVMGKYNEKYLDHLSSIISESIRNAMDEMEPAKIGFGHTTLEGLTYNRRSSKYSIDTNVDMIHIESSNGTEIADLIWGSCHPLTFPTSINEFSSDFPGAITRNIESSGHIALFFQQGLGDVVPIIPKDKSKTKEDRMLEQIEKIGIGFADKVEEMHENLKVSETLTMNFVESKYPLNPINVNVIPDILFPLEFIARAAIDRYHMPEETTISLTHLNNGYEDVVIANFPFELTSGIAISLREGLEEHCDRAIVTSLANDWHSYLMEKESMKFPRLTPEHIESFFGRGYAESLMDYVNRIAEIMHTKKKVGNPH